MSDFNQKRVILGTHGKVWMDDERMANVKSCEAKAKIDYEDMEVNGMLATQKRMLGYSISGTMTLHKFDSFVLKKYKEVLATGVTPDMRLVVALDDPAAMGAERALLTDVQLDELTIISFENKKLLEEEVPFTAGGVEFIDLI